ncbi:MAG: hypothetical protein ACHP6H_03445 [Legionellales bacterium]
MVRYFNIILFSFIILFPNMGLAGWVGPVAVIVETWGSANNQIGLEVSESGDILPEGFWILNNKIIIRDQINKRMKIYNIAGQFERSVDWVKQQNGIYKINEYPLAGLTVGYGGDNIYTYFPTRKSYIIYSSSGSLLQTLAVKPSELGVIKSTKRNVDGGVSIVIQYGDAVFNINLPKLLEYFVRDLSGYLYGVIITGTPGNQHYSVYKYNKSGKALGIVDLPARNVIVEPETVPARPTPEYTVVADYGKPVIAPNGDVYTWKRTPDKYAILKWTWVDDAKESKEL